MDKSFILFLNLTLKELSCNHYSVILCELLLIEVDVLRLFGISFFIFFSYYKLCCIIQIQHCRFSFLIENTIVQVFIKKEGFSVADHILQNKNNISLHLPILSVKCILRCELNFWKCRRNSNSQASRDFSAHSVVYKIRLVSLQVK